MMLVLLPHGPSLLSQTAHPLLIIYICCPIASYQPITLCMTRLFPLPSLFNTLTLLSPTPVLPPRKALHPKATLHTSPG